MAARVIALVESPAQLLNVLEWAYQHKPDALPPERMGEQVEIFILPPPEPIARVQLDRMSDLAVGVGCTVSWHEVRGNRAVRLRALLKIRAAVSAARTVVIGDPFSGVLQLLMDSCRIRELVIVDDGSASIRFVEILESGEELVRWHHNDSRTLVDRAIAARARRRMANPRQLFTAMQVDSSAIRIERNTLAWTRRQYPAPTLLPGADLIGSSLVETGVVAQENYLQAVAALLHSHRVTRYLAHRRESNAKLSAIGALGVEVVRPQLPLELFARKGPVAERLISFPSTVVHTLPLVLADTRVELRVCDVEESWLKPGPTSVRSMSFLRSVTSSARLRHGLTSIAPV